jgi:hypothetical protein
MSSKFFRLSLAACLLPLASAHGQAQTLGFEGTTLDGRTRQLDVAIADAFGPSLVNYAGYDWLGMYVNKPLVSVNKPSLITGVSFEEDESRMVPVYATTPVDAGFHRSAVSGDTVAYTQAFGSETFGSISARPGELNFNFTSVYLTSGWRDDITVFVTGKRGGATAFSRTLTVGDDAPTRFDLNFSNISSIEFLASGGTFLYPNGTTVGSYLNPSNAFSSPVLVFDNLSIAAVPEPESFAMMLAGLGMLGALVRWRKTAAP